MINSVIRDFHKVPHRYELSVHLTQMLAMKNIHHAIILFRCAPLGQKLIHGLDLEVLVADDLPQDGRQGAVIGLI